MNPFDTFDEGYSQPPPAYSEQEFDQKVARAVVLSQEVEPILGDDEREPYDPAAFDAAEYHPQQGKANNLGSHRLAGPALGPAQERYPIQQIQPLRIQKKANPSLDMELKEEPRWMPLAQRHEGPSGSTPHAPRNAFDGDDLAPPPFTQVPPDPYLRQVSGDTEFDPYSMIAPSPPPSIRRALPQPPHSNTPAMNQYVTPEPSAQQGGRIPQLSTPMSIEPTVNAYRQSMPVSPSNPRTRRADHRPYSELDLPAQTFQTQRTERFSSGPSMLQFNPSIAYGRATQDLKQPQVTPVQEHRSSSGQVFNAASFYNAAVTPHMQAMSRAPACSSNLSPSTVSSPSYANPTPLRHSNALGLTSHSSHLSNSAWSPANRPASVFSMESSYSDNTEGRLNPYGTSMVRSLNNDWQNRNR